MHGTGAETFVVVMIAVERQQERREVVIWFLIIERKLSRTCGIRRYEMSETKPFSISKHWVYEAYLKVQSNGGSGGVDGISLKEFGKDYRNHLYKLWNKMSSGSYIPPPVKLMEIPKKGGGLRPLGIPKLLSYYLFPVCVRNVLTISKFQQKSGQFQID